MDEHILSGPTDDWPIFRESLGEKFLSNLRSYGTKVLQVFPQEQHESTAHWILEEAAAEAARLRVAPGDVVAACCVTSPHVAPLMLATLCAGAVFAPVNAQLPQVDLTATLESLGAKIVYTDYVHLEAVRKAWAHTTPLVMGTAPKTSTKLTVAALDCMEHKTAILLGSSGTTGRPKFIILTHGNISTMLHAVGRSDSLITGEDTLIFASPAFWVSGHTALMWSLGLGSKYIVLPEFKEESFLANAEKYKATVGFVSPNRLVSLVKFESPNTKDKLQSLRFFFSGGSSMDGSTQKFISKHLNTTVLQWYGLTEGFPLLGSRSSAVPPPMGSVGILTPFVQVKVVDLESGVSLPAGHDGELLFRGPMVSPGYLHAPIRQEQWFATGDVGRYDQHGFFYIVDRIKQLIKCQSEHVAPAEIEAVLLEHPDVSEVVVLGKPHPTDQEHPTAFVVLRPGATVTEEFLQSLVTSKIANPLKHLRGGVHFIDTLPKSATGKVKRGELRIQLEQMAGFDISALPSAHAAS